MTAASRLALLAVAGLTAPAEAGEARLAYDVYAGGFRVGQVEAAADVTDRAYEARAQFTTAGTLADLFPVRFVFAAQGTRKSPALRPRRYHSQFFGFAGDPIQDVAFDGKAPTLDPDWTRGRGPGAVLREPFGTDPVTAVVAALLRAPDTACDRTIRLFDGIRVYEIALGPPRGDTLTRYAETYFVGEALRCPWEYRLVSARKEDWANDLFGETPPSGDIWFAELPTGLTPVRFLAETPIVNVVVHLMSVDGGLGEKPAGGGGDGAFHPHP